SSRVRRVGNIQHGNPTISIPYKPVCIISNEETYNLATIINTAGISVRCIWRIERRNSAAAVSHEPVHLNTTSIIEIADYVATVTDARSHCRSCIGHIERDKALRQRGRGAH